MDIKIVDFEVLALVVVASMALAKIFEMVKARVCPWWDQLTDVQRWLAGLAISLTSAGLMALTNLNMLPGFSRIWQPGGYILTDIAAGLGPSLVYDIALAAKKEPPASS